MGKPVSSFLCLSSCIGRVYPSRNASASRLQSHRRLLAKALYQLPIFISKISHPGK
jgi:hypothetical protein